jgi:exodeoxyribonuclease X
MTVIRVVDFETTGTEPPAEVCEVGICDLDLESKIIGPVNSWLCRVKTMPPEVRAIHHIKLSDCEGWDRFDVVEEAMLYEGKPTAFAAHNAEFECKFFQPYLPMICTYKAALRAWPEAPSHSNGALRYWLEDQGLISPDHVNTQPSHRSGPDAYVTAHLLLALFNAGHTGKEMVAWTKEPQLFRDKPAWKVSR